MCMYIGLSIVSVYLLLLPYFAVNKDYQKLSTQCVRCACDAG